MDVARRVGMVATWPNLETIRVSIESEAEFSAISFNEALDLILACASCPSLLPQYSAPAEWEKREISRANTINRFWFEDALWRVKFPYIEFRATRREEAKANSVGVE
jgi:hypothetical protein